MDSRREYSSNVVRVLHPTTNNNWEGEHYETKSSRKVLDSSSDHQLSSTNFIREAQSNYSSRSNYSTKNNREIMDDDFKHNLQQQKNGIIETSNLSKNVGYLDELLDDLKNERNNNDINTEFNTSYKYTNSNIPEVNHMNKRVEYIETKKHRSDNNIVNPEIYNTTKSISSGNIIEHNPNTGRTVKKTEHIEILPKHGSTIHRSQQVEVHNSKNLESTSLLPHSKINSETIIKRDAVLDNINHHSDLSKIQLDTTISEDLLPLPGTKVTTTVRTYTYEVPSVITRSNVLYHDDDITGTKINKNYSEKIINVNDNYMTKINDTNIIDKNLPLSNDDMPDSIGGPKRTYYYKREVHNTNNTVNVPPPEPFINEYHIIKNTTNTTTTNKNLLNNEPLPTLRPISPVSSPPNFTHHTYITKTTTTNDYTDGSIPHDSNTYDGPKPIYYDSNPRPHSPNGPITQTYIKSHEKTTNTTLPFPVNGTTYPIEGSIQPPKKLDDLMASFDKNKDDGDTDDLRRKREIDTSIANTDNKVRVPSKNQSGPPVFYPQNAEMTLRQKEGGGGAWRAQGGYAAGASGYEYQAESSSKTKSKSGAAVVPVCLPLCCAMPCVLM